MTSDDQPARRGKPRPVTSVDVARAAGVSQSTVSLVIGGRATGRVSDETRVLVEATAAKLGYVPNSSARVLRGGSSQVIGLAVPNVRHEYFGRVLLAAEQAARDKGMAVVLIGTASDSAWVERTIAMSQTGLLAGVIIYAEGPLATEKLAHVIHNAVFVECPEDFGKSAIDIDIAGGMREVVAHLYRLGHRRIGHARASMGRETFRLRARHLAAELATRDIDFDPSWQYESSFDLSESTSRAVEFLRNTQVTALFCDDDILAASVYRACRQLQLRIPTDLSVVGFNDMDLASYLAPELTSVAIPAEEVGRAAVETLINAMDGKFAAPVLLPLTLAVRESTGPPS
jgi:DNA-binding LacI/PurR family transcriptional regulator